MTSCSLSSLNSYFKTASMSHINTSKGTVQLSYSLQNINMQAEVRFRNGMGTSVFEEIIQKSNQSRKAPSSFQPSERVRENYNICRVAEMMLCDQNRSTSHLTSQKLYTSVELCDELIILQHSANSLNFCRKQVALIMPVFR